MGRMLLIELAPELNKIKNDGLLKITKNLLVKNCCDYMLEVGASSSTKYHPHWALGRYGLLRHTKAVAAVTERLLMMMPQYDDWNFDIPYIAAILHDCAKYTEHNQEHTHQDHPLRMGQIIQDNVIADSSITSFYVDAFTRIKKCVEAHMSRWNTDRNGNVLGNVPSNMEEMIIAMADMTVASKFIDIKFDVTNNLC
jgi:hypothetical protein